ncbi:MAG: hypothetical protein HKN16_06100, partial [Saprospiraceae bacterium]|nr:hypothetical protein [Saprospiraceae bacterium]
MQDKYWLASVEAELLDESWHKMKRLLDEEMPHAVPPKPGRPKYEILVLLALFAWTVYLYWPNPEDRHNWKADLTPDKVEMEELALLETPIQPLENIVSIATASESAEPVSSFAKNNQHKKTHASKISNASHSPIIASRAMGILPVPELSSPNKPSEEVVFLENNKIGISGPSQSHSFTPVIKTKSGGFNLGIRAGEIVDRNAYSGFSLGLFGEWSLNERFSLFSGLEYHQIKKINPAENSFSAAEDFFDMEPSTQLDRQAMNAGLSILYGTYSGNSEFKVLGIDQMDYVSVPLELVFKVNNRMRVNAGLGISYLASAKMQNDERPEGWASADLKDETELSSLQGNELLGTAIQRWDVAPTIGFSFKPV